MKVNALIRGALNGTDEKNRVVGGYWMLHNEKTFRGEARLSTWLFSILKNQICNYFRMIRRKGLEITQSLDLLNDKDDRLFSMTIADWSLPENQIIRKEDEKSVLKAISNLPKTMQKTALLYIFHELKLKEIAQQLNCPEGTVRSKRFRIKKYLDNPSDLSE